MSKGRCNHLTWLGIELLNTTLDIISTGEGLTLSDLLFSAHALQRVYGHVPGTGISWNRTQHLTTPTCLSGDQLLRLLLASSPGLYIVFMQGVDYWLACVEG